MLITESLLEGSNPSSIAKLINMACHCLYLEDASEFWKMMKERESDLIMKMVKCVMSASKRNKDKIDIFDIVFKDTSELTFSIEKKQYKELLTNCIKDMVKIEEYELCAAMQKEINKKRRKKVESKID